MAADPSYRPLTYRRAGGDEIVVASGGKLIIESGGTLEAESGSTMSLPDISVQVSDLGLAIGSIIVGTTGAKGVALDAKTTGRLLIGDGTTLASVAMQGDATIIANGTITVATAAACTGNAATVTTNANLTGPVTSVGNATTVTAGAITAAMLANNAAGLNSVGMGASASYAKTTNGVQTLATGTAGAKTCLFVVSVTQTFVTNGGGNEQPTFKFGEVGTDDKFSVAALLTDATAGQIKVFPGALTASTNVICTATAAAGTGEGAIAVSVIILPTAI